jgi:hypothetical protein
MRGRPRTAIAGTLVAAVTVALLAAPASPARDGRPSGPVATTAGFPQTANGQVPGGGEATVTTSDLPQAVHKATIDVEPRTAADASLFGGLAMTFAHQSSRGHRVLLCVFVAQASLRYGNGDETVAEQDPTLVALFLHLCIRLALSLPLTHSADAASPASAACSTTAKAIGIQVTRVSGGYRGQLSGRTHKPKSSSPTVITCRRKGSASC